MLDFVTFSPSSSPHTKFSKLLWMRASSVNEAVVTRLRPLTRDGGETGTSKPSRLLVRVRRFVSRDPCLARYLSAVFSGTHDRMAPWVTRAGSQGQVQASIAQWLGGQSVFKHGMLRADNLHGCDIIFSEAQFWGIVLASFPPPPPLPPSKALPVSERVFDGQACC